ncbi:Lnb N-terminal periplasmic domain-containing protein [Pseudomonas sp. B392_1p]|uniref:Lnb N-terminal periplasmic domain-containing protein n=1 Tax=Pseudomonas sp. B392_1p TaxID=3457507 RepID=UPI003FD5423D
MTRPHPLLRLSARLLLTLFILLTSTWGALALTYRLDWVALAGYALVTLWCLFGAVALVLLWRRSAWPALAGHLLVFAVLLAWWHNLQPSNQRAWADDVARMTRGRVVDEQLLLDNVRNFVWRSDEDYDIAWESRAYDLRQLTSVDLLTSYWGMPAIAHILVSFGFEDGRHLVFTVETRKERGELYSELGGFFKEFELSIVATDERDAVRVRTNVRDEDVYLYRIDMPRSVMRELLLSYVEQANALAERPRFYNTLTANCTTIVFGMVQSIIGGLPVDHRLLLTGYLPGYVQDIGGLQQGYSLDELRDRGRITERAKQADDAPDFSALVRQGIPGWTSETHR